MVSQSKVYSWLTPHKWFFPVIPCINRWIRWHRQTDTDKPAEKQTKQKKVTSTPLPHPPTPPKINNNNNKQTSRRVTGGPRQAVPPGVLMLALTLICQIQNSTHGTDGAGARIPEKQTPLWKETNWETVKPHEIFHSRATLLKRVLYAGEKSAQWNWRGKKLGRREEIERYLWPYPSQNWVELLVGYITAVLQSLHVQIAWCNAVFSVSTEENKELLKTLQRKETELQLLYGKRCCKSVSFFHLLRSGLNVFLD